VVLCMTASCEINNTLEMRARLSLLECKLSETKVTKEYSWVKARWVGEGSGNGQATADQVPVCSSSLDFKGTTLCTQR